MAVVRLARTIVLEEQPIVVVEVVVLARKLFGAGGWQQSRSLVQLYVFSSAHSARIHST